MLKVLHLADLHLDSPFRTGGASGAEMRRKELREAFSSIIEYVKLNKTDIVLMAGDLFDSEMVTGETTAFFIKELASCPSCRFIISPGNHDPYIPTGVYAKQKFPENVYIFSENALSSFSFPELNAEVYGYAFEAPSMAYNPIKNARPGRSDTINLLCGHADIGNPLSPYCPISEKDIEGAGFDYCAFGHIHQSLGVKRAGVSLYAYSGCVEGRDFGETGYKGGLALEISKERGIADVKTSFVRFSKRRYEVERLDISGASDERQILENIVRAVDKNGYGKDTLLRIALAGSVSPELKIDFASLEKVLSKHLFYVEINDKTLPLYDAEKLDRDPTIRGAVFRELRYDMENGDEEQKERAARALKVALAALSGEDFTSVG